MDMYTVFAASVFAGAGAYVGYNGVKCTVWAVSALVAALWNK